jgi:hypothetical protein
LSRLSYCPTHSKTSLSRSHVSNTHPKTSLSKSTHGDRREKTRRRKFGEDCKETVSRLVFPSEPFRTMSDDEASAASSFVRPAAWDGLQRASPSAPTGHGRSVGHRGGGLPRPRSLRDSLSPPRLGLPTKRVPLPRPVPLPKRTLGHFSVLFSRASSYRLVSWMRQKRHVVPTEWLWPIYIWTSTSSVRASRGREYGRHDDYHSRNTKCRGEVRDSPAAPAAAHDPRTIPRFDTTVPYLRRTVRPVSVIPRAKSE